MQEEVQGAGAMGNGNPGWEPRESGAEQLGCCGTAYAGGGLGGAAPELMAPARLYVLRRPQPLLCVNRADYVLADVEEPRPTVGERIEFDEYVLTRRVTLDATAAAVARTDVPVAPKTPE